MQGFRVWTCLFGVALLAVVPAPPKTPRPERPPLLGTSVVPLSYNLRIDPDALTPARGGTADGEESIVVDVRTPTASVVLNAAGIRIRSAEIDGARASAAVYPIAEQLALSAGRTLRPGRHVLHIRFVGRLMPDAAGLWPDGFAAPDAPNLVSLFEPATARTLFPCFDEPRFRARFTLHVVAPSNWRAISNMPLARTSAASAGKTTFSFEATPPIPTYLLAIDMGVFTAVHGTVGTTPVSVYVRPGQTQLARSVLRDARDALAFYEREFGSAYPMPKLDIVVAPGVLNDTAESPGAITIYSEYDVAGKQFGGGLRGRQNAFAYVAEPEAQQWLGGLAGIASWQDSWLTTSLAAWAEARAEAAVRPQFAAIPKDIDWPWNAISLWGSLDPLRTQFPDDRNRAAFDSLMAGAADAGEAIAGQWDAYAGDARMRAAVHRFLHEYAWRTATTADFWSAFGSSAAQRYGSAWLNQPGAPMVDVALRCSGSQQFATLEQRPLSGDYFHGRTGALWPVPVRLSAGGQTSWVMLSHRRLQVRAGSCGDAVLADAGLRPPYPARYPIADLRRLAHAPLAPVDRLRIWRDESTLYHGNAATLPELLGALRIGAASPAVAGASADAYDDLAAAAQALQNSPYAAAFYASVNASLLPFVREAGFDPAPSEKDVLARIYRVLDYAPDPRLARSALGAWQRLRSSDRFFSFQAWSVSAYAAAAGSPADFDWALAHVADNRNEILADDPFWFLSGARDDRTIEQIFATLQKRRVDYPGIVWQIGRYRPRLVSAYLQSHVRDVLAAVPPSQQGWTLTDGVANGPWTARTPAAWRAFFTSALPASDRGDIEKAMQIINAGWALRRRLEAQMSSARALARSRPKSHSGE